MSALTPSPDSSPDLLDTPITDVIRQSAASTRLRNALINAGNVLPFETVREYCEAGDAAKEKFLRIQNLGRRSVNELDDLVRAFLAEGPFHVPTPSISRELTLDAIRQALTKIFADFRFPDVFLEGAISTRLGNALRNTPQLPGQLSEFLEDVPQTLYKLRSRGNVGEVSIDELLDLAGRFTADILRTAGFSKGTISAAHGIIFDRHVASAEALTQLDVAVKNARTISAENEPSARTVREIASELIGTLADRDRAVIERRYGFLTGKVETLEEIAFSYKLTRERIRQIEAKQLKRIGRTKLSKDLRTSFEREIASRLVRATEGLAYIKASEVPQVIRKLDAADRFAIDILYESREKFLSGLATRWRGNWLLPPLVKDDLKEILKTVRTRLASICLPAAMSEVAAGMPEDRVRAAIALDSDLSIVEGYVFAGRVGARALRTIGLHQCLVASGRFLEVSDLVSRYQRAAPNDKHSSVRDAMIVMLMAPHLFLGVFDRHWHGVGDGGDVTKTLQARSDLADLGTDHDAPESANYEGIRVLLRRILRDRGPLRFVDLRERAVRRLHGKSPHSVGPILLTSGDFVRPLPGIYALPDQIPAASSILFEPPSFLLAEEQVRYLAEARYAGEAYGPFPMWIPESEYALCRWARTNCNPDLFQSLLSVASIDRWPVSTEEREHWSSLKRTHSRYCLAVPPRYPIRQLWPPLDRLLAACIVARQNKGLSWITANRVLKRRLDAHVSPGLLALMVALGALEAPAHWQMFHKAGDRLTTVAESLSRCLHERGTLDWDSSAGKHLLEEDLTLARSGASSGWVDAEVVGELLSAARQRTPAPLPTVGEADESTSSLEDLLREVAESAKAEVAHQTMRVVLGTKAS